MMDVVETDTTAPAGAGAGVGSHPSTSSRVWSEPIVRADLIGTAAFAVSATVAAVVFTGPTRVVGVVVALALFAAGVFAFLWSYFTAINRSRTDNIAVAQLYFLVSGSAPKPVRRAMMSALACQVVVALATAIARSSTDGRAGSTLAFGILVPMFGLGLNGLWCSKHGSFSARQAPAASTRSPSTGATGDPDPNVADPNVADPNVADPNVADPNVADPNVEGVPPSDDEMEQNSRHG